MKKHRQPPSPVHTPFSAMPNLRAISSRAIWKALSSRTGATWLSLLSQVYGHFRVFLRVSFVLCRQSHQIVLIRARPYQVTLGYNKYTQIITRHQVSETRSSIAQDSVRGYRLKSHSNYQKPTGNRKYPQSHTKSKPTHQGNKNQRVCIFLWRPRSTLYTGGTWGIVSYFIEWTRPDLHYWRPDMVAAHEFPCFLWPRLSLFELDSVSLAHFIRFVLSTTSCLFAAEPPCLNFLFLGSSYGFKLSEAPEARTLVGLVAKLNSVHGCCLTDKHWGTQI